MFWIDGRFSWPWVLAVLVSTLALVITDFIWRTIEMPAVATAGIGAALLLASNAAVFLLARSR